MAKKPYHRKTNQGYHQKKKPYLLFMNDLIYKLCSYFSGNAKRLNILKNQELIDEVSQLKLIKALDVRWLSNLYSIDRVIQIFPQIINSLQQIYEEDFDNRAFSTLDKLTEFHNFSSIHILF